MWCKHCNCEMDPTSATWKYPHCNTWTCPRCGKVEPEAGSLHLAGRQEEKNQTELERFEEQLEEILDRALERFAKRMESIVDKSTSLDMVDWYCPDHSDGFKEFDGEHWVCVECGEPLQEKSK